MKTDFDPGVKETTPKLVVHAGLDNADSTLTLHITKTSPLAGVQVESMQPFEGRQVAVELYEDDRLLLKVDNPEPEGWNIFVQEKVQSVAAGRTYRLRVSVDGFDAVESKVVAPAALELAECSIDTSRLLLKNSIWSIGNDTWRYSEWFDMAQFHPAKIGIVDINTDKRYYEVEVEYRELDSVGQVAQRGLMWVGTVNELLLQDNPYIENGDLINADSDAPDVFLFQQMVLSNFLFANKTCEEEFLVSAFHDHSKEEWLSRGYAEEELEEVVVTATVKVKRLTTELFEYYRAGVLHGSSGADATFFFEEPVSVPSNISSGYGNFSVATAVQREVDRRSMWRAKQRYY
jgi:hypothetical protein